MNIANVITLFRVVLTPIFIIFLFYNFPNNLDISIVILLLASITDIYDGIYARRFNKISEWGKELDPLADKFLILSALISYSILEEISTILTFVIISRELIVLFIRFYYKTNEKELSTSSLSKIKTLILMVFINLHLIMMFLKNSNPNPLFYNISSIYYEYDMEFILFLIAVAVSLISGYNYYSKFKTDFNTGE